MKRFAIVLLVSLITLVAAVAGAADATPSAREIAQRSFDIVAGAAWDDARYVAFTFNVERDGKTGTSRSHRWDRFTGEYRVEGRDREGRTYIVLFNLDTKEGRAWLDGEKQSDPSDLLERGYGAFINDTYWLLVPAKMMDPGVNLEAAGTRTDDCGRTYDGVKLSFDEVGLTPGDQYWFWIDRDTGLVNLWQMQLQNMKPEDPKREYLFREYQRIGGLLISLSRPALNGSARIWFSGVDVRPDVPKGAFE